MPGEVERRARRHRPDDGEERTGEPRRQRTADEHDHHDRSGETERRPMHVARSPQDEHELIEGVLARDREAEHLAQRRDADLDADAGEEPDQHGLREEIGEEAELEQPREEQVASRQQRHQPRERLVPRAPGRRQLRESVGDDRCGRRVRRHDQAARGAERRERHHWQEERVKAGDDGGAGDTRIAEHLGDVHRGEREPGQDVAHGFSPVDRPEAPEEPRRARPPRRVVRHAHAAAELAMGGPRRRGVPVASTCNRPGFMAISPSAPVVYVGALALVAILVIGRSALRRKAAQ